MPGTLFVVATPIGNLEDITLRALRVLREVALIAAEDTRRTGKLLSHFGIPARTISFHEHNSRARVPLLLRRLHGGDPVALVTDAGTPGVSDPGSELVRACLLEGIPVDPIPGVSAPLTAAVASGFPVTPMTILGFAPARSRDRLAWLEDVAGILHTVTFFDAPHRVRRTLTDCASILGNRPMVAARELTKVHQEFIAGTAVELLARLDAPRGEFTLVIGPSTNNKPAEGASDEAVAEEFWRLTSGGQGSRREILARVAHNCGRSVRDVYAAVERSKEPAQ